MDLDRHGRKLIVDGWLLDGPLLAAHPPRATTARAGLRPRPAGRTAWAARSARRGRECGGFVDAPDRRPGRRADPEFLSGPAGPRVTGHRGSVSGGDGP